MLISPTTPSSSASARVVSRDPVEHLVAEAHRRQHAGGVAGVDAGLLDVLHDAGERAVAAVAERVDVDLDRVLEEAVEQQRVLAVGLRVAGSGRSPRSSVE